MVNVNECGLSLARNLHIWPLTQAHELVMGPLVCIKIKTFRSCEFVIATYRTPVHTPFELFWQAFWNRKYNSCLYLHVIFSFWILYSYYNLYAHIHKYTYMSVRYCKYSYFCSSRHISIIKNVTHTQHMTWQDWWLHLYPPLILAFCAPGQVQWERDRESEQEVWLLSLRYAREDNGGWTLLTAVLTWWGRLYRSAFAHNFIEMSNIVTSDCHPFSEIWLFQSLRIFVNIYRYAIWTRKKA